MNNTSRNELLADNENIRNIKRYYRVDENGILRSATINFPRLIISESKYNCTIIGKMTYYEYKIAHKCIWGN